MFSLSSEGKLVIFSSETEAYLSLQMLGMVLRNVSSDYPSECHDCMYRRSDKVLLKNALENRNSRGAYASSLMYNVCVSNRTSSE